MDPSTPKTASSGKRRKQPKSCRLVRLPEHILFQIFSYEDVLTSSSLGVCRALAPVAFKALYRNVYLKSREQIQRFAWALRRRSERAALVLRLSLSDKEHTKDRPCAAAWQPERGDSGSGQLVDFDPAASSSSVVVGIGLVKDILRLLVNLDSFHIAGVAIFAPLLQRDFLETLPYPSLSVLCLQAITGEVVPSSLLYSLTRVPSLREVTVLNVDGSMLPGPLNLGSQISVPPRSLRLQSFCIMGSVRLRSELRILLQALSLGLKTVTVSSCWAYPNLLSDMALLPPTLTELVLDLGPLSCITAKTASSTTRLAMGICEDESPKSRSDLLSDKLVAVHWHFPNLVSVAVQGTLLPPDTLDILVSLPSLRTLDLGAHTTFPLSSLLNFIRAAPSLHNLFVDVCECVPHSAAVVARKKCRPPPPRLVWRKGFGLEDAKALIGACVEKGVAVGGTIRCATKMVYAGDGHLCRGWCK